MEKYVGKGYDETGWHNELWIVVFGEKPVKHNPTINFFNNQNHLRVVFTDEKLIVFVDCLCINQLQMLGTNPSLYPIATVIYHYVIYDEGHCIYKFGENHDKSCTKHYKLHTNHISPIAELNKICPIGSTKIVYWMDEDCIADCECKFDQPTFLHYIFVLNWSNVLFLLLVIILIIATICLCFQCVKMHRAVDNMTNAKRVKFAVNKVDETTPLRMDNNKYYVGVTEI